MIQGEITKAQLTRAQEREVKRKLVKWLGKPNLKTWPLDVILDRFFTITDAIKMTLKDGRVILITHDEIGVPDGEILH